VNYQLPAGFTVDFHDEMDRDMPTRLVAVNHRGRTLAIGVRLLGLDVAEAQRCAVANLVAVLADGPSADDALDTR
jgi:hypothetical protein